MSAIITPSNQIRYNDPYTQRIFQYDAPAEHNKYYLAREVNNLLKIYGDKVLQGLTIKSSSVDSETGDLTITIEKGVAIVDSTLIFIEDDVTITYSNATVFDLSDGFFAVFLNYRWLQTIDDNPLKVTVFYVNATNSTPEYGFDANRDRVLVGFVKVNPDTLETINYCGVDDKVTIDNETYYVGSARGVERQPFESYVDSAMSSERLFSNLHEKISISTTFINKPSITSPTNNQTDFMGSIESSPFTTTNNFYGIHSATDWEIASDQDFNNIVEASYNDSTNLTSYTPSNLQPLTTYYVRVRYKSDYHISPYSDPVKFTTAEAYIETPTISCSTGDSLYPTFNLTPFNTYGWTDNWQSTDWEIATDSDFNNVIRSYTETNPDNQSIWSITDDLLDVNSTYYIRAKYNGDQGHSSNWSSTYTLNTGLYQIEYSIPTQENEQTTINTHVTHDNGREFNTSQYTLNGSVTHGTLTISGMDATWELPDVTEDTTASITLYVTRNSDSVEVTDHLTKSLTIKAITMVTDDAVVISDFSQYDYNDGWSI